MPQNAECEFHPRDRRADSMSSARTKPHHAELGDAIVARLRASALPATPRDFEFWFAYESGRHPALNAAADAIRLKGGLGAADIERLHGQHLSPWRTSEGADTITATLAGKLHGVAATLDGAIGAARAQRETMIAETSDLSITSALTLQRVLGAIDRLTQSTKDGQVRCALVEARMSAATREIAALKQQLAAVRTECEADPVTSLARRTTFDAVLAKALDQAAASRQPLAVVLCDLDYFAAFNENFGATAADRVLRTVGVLLRSHAGADDTVARFGGDEFAVIMPLRRVREAADCAERFRQVLMLHELVKHENGGGRITVSIGVADAIKGDTPAYLLRRASNGLKVAKQEGRNRVVEMTPDGPTWNAKRPA
jgi:diguanylate cyclase